MALIRNLISRPPSRLLTRTGKQYLIAFIVFLVPSYLLAHNMLFYLAGIFLTVFFYDLFYLKVMMRHLEVDLVNRPRFFAKQTANLMFVIRSKRSFGALHFLECHLTGTKQQITGLPIPQLQAGERLELAFPLMFDRRGPQHLETVQLVSSYPFGFWQMSLDFKLDIKLLVSPQLLDLEGENQSFKVPARGRVPRNTGDYQYLAPYQAGEDVRLIHWKKLALHPDPVIRKDLVQPRSSKRRILMPDPTPDFELALSLVATWLVLGEQDQDWLFWTEDGAQEPLDLEQALAILALLAPLNGLPDSPELLSQGLHPVYTSELVAQVGSDLKNASHLEPEPTAV